jgi:hypothetical protein
LELVPNQASELLPLIWAAKHTHVEKENDLGALYGFVDARMSLLALEEDRLPDNIAQEYDYEGVPPLTPEEIIVDADRISPAPAEDIIFEFTSAETHVDKLRTQPIGIHLLGRGLLEIRLKSAPESRNTVVQLYALNGRLVHSWDQVDFRNACARISLPEGLRGTFVLRVKGTAERMERTVTIP